MQAPPPTTSWEADAHFRQHADPAKLRSGLPGLPEEVDFTIIGTGFAGLSAALRLSQAFPSLRILVVGGDNSGQQDSDSGDVRGAGICSTHSQVALGGCDIDGLVSNLGTGRAADVVRLGQEAVRHAVALVKDELQCASECGLEENGVVYAAETKRQVNKACAMKAASDAIDSFQQRASSSSELWNGPQCEARLRTNRVRCAYYERAGATFDPLVVLQALLRQVCSLEGVVAVHKNVSVVTIEWAAEAGRPSRLRVAETCVVQQGQIPRQTVFVTTRFLLHATTSAPKSGAMYDSQRPLPQLHVPFIATAPLSGKQLTSIFGEQTAGAGRFSWLTLHRLSIAVRITPTNRIICSGGPGIRCSDVLLAQFVSSRHAYTHLEAALLRYFPGLAGVAIEQRWESMIATTFLSFPIGRVPGGAAGTFFANESGHSASLSLLTGDFVRDYFEQDLAKFSSAMMLPGLLQARSFCFTTRYSWQTVPSEIRRTSTGALSLVTLRWLDSLDARGIEPSSLIVVIAAFILIIAGTVMIWYALTRPCCGA